MYHCCNVATHARLLQSGRSVDEPSPSGVSVNEGAMPLCESIVESCIRGAELMIIHSFLLSVPPSPSRFFVRLTSQISGLVSALLHDVLRCTRMY